MGKIKCLECGQVLESKTRHDFVSCGCPNGSFVDGGQDYMRAGGKDLNKIEVIKDDGQTEPLIAEEQKPQNPGRAIIREHFLDSTKETVVMIPVGSKILSLNATGFDIIMAVMEDSEARLGYKERKFIPIPEHKIFDKNGKRYIGTVKVSGRYITHIFEVK